MAIEIRELVVRTTVVPPAQPPPNTAPTAASVDPLSMEAKEALIQACVSQVLAILDNQKER